MQRYDVTGMTCAACSARVEKAVSAVQGVSACSVNLLTNSMTVEGNVKSSAVISAVKKAGYGAVASGEKTRSEPEVNHESGNILIRLISSIVFLAALMYFSMGQSMLGLPLPAFFHENYAATGLVQLLLSGIVMVINQKFFINGFKGAIHLSPNMDTLVSLGSAASFGWSVYVLFLITDAQLVGDTARAAGYTHELYFESAAMILNLITVGKLLEARSKGKTADALNSLIKLAPKTATVIRNGEELTVSADTLRKGDIFTVRPGESIPADGVVLEGVSAVNESALTGESIPVDKAAGDSVAAACINTSGFLKCEATRVGEETSLSRIIKLVSDATAQKAPISRIADRVAGVFVPVVLTIALVTAIVWLILGAEFSFALSRAIAVLVISCPCSLGLATPVAIMAGSGVGAKNGILFKTAAALEQAGKTRIAALDKTGTITKGEPKVTDIIPISGITSEELLTAAASLEAKSEHPLGRAITEYASENGIKAVDVTDFAVFAGNGLKAVLGNNELVGGSVKYISTLCELDKQTQSNAELLCEQGKTPLLFARNKKLLGMISVADTVKEDSPKAISELKRMGIKTVMLTGDNARTANATAKIAGVDEVISEVLPQEKAAQVARLKTAAGTAMVGDGINDAPALASADTGIAIGTGTDVAIDSADVVVMKSGLSGVAAAIRLSRRTLTIIKENLFWAFIYNIIGIPLAAGVFASLGITLSPMFAAAAMSLSSVCVVLNALRLNFFKPYRFGHEAKDVKARNVDTDGCVIMEIDGMMCGHCESHVKKALEALPQVISAKPDYKRGTAELELSKPVSEKLLTKAVEKQGYRVKSIKRQ